MELKVAPNYQKDPSSDITNSIYIYSIQRSESLSTRTALQVYNGNITQ